MKLLLTMLSTVAISTLAWSAPQSIIVPTTVIEKSYQRHPVTGDVYIDLIEVMQKINVRLLGAELISVEFYAKTEEISASDIWLAINGRMENSLLLAKKDNDQFTPKTLSPLDRTPISQAALVFRGQTSLTQIKIIYNSRGTLP